ncbi:MAG: LuxR C-terminal-related transcriptional regulator [Beijerinckiaceae bacterium]
MIKSNLPSAAMAANVKPYILVIDPRALTRGCVVHVLRMEFPECAVEEVVTFSDCAAHSTAPPRLIILGLDHDEQSDVEVARRLRFLREAFPKAPIALMCEDDDHSLEAAIRHGCSGYLPTSLPLAVAVAALRLVMVGGSYFPNFPQLDRVGGQSVAPAGDRKGSGSQGPILMAEIGLPIALPAIMAPVEKPETITSHAALVGGAFTPRELQVIAALQRGLSNKIIAADLGMSENTVKVHVRHVMRKLRATNRTQAALMSRARFEGAPA